MPACLKLRPAFRRASTRNLGARPSLTVCVCVCVCSDVNGNGPLESTLRSYRALALQLMRRTVTPENRPDAVRGVICMTYMVGH